MAELDSVTCDDLPVLRDAIAASLGGAYWTVDDGGWSGMEPSRPSGVGDLLAAPVVVGATPIGPQVDLPEIPAVGSVGSGDDPLSLLTSDVEPAVAPAPPRPGRHRRVARVA